GPVLSDRRVLLRAWRGDDAEWYAAAVPDPEIQRFTSEPPTLTAMQVRTAIDALAEAPDLVGLVICDAASGRRLGNIGLRRLGDGMTGEVSYGVAAEGRGRGVATAALRLLTVWATTTLGLSEVRLWCHAGNIASRRVAERAGYQRAPTHDGHRVVKGDTWPVVGYTFRGLGQDAPSQNDERGDKDVS
ncbi:MAG: GNAT family N-acetyltransferase, partial [Sporichthyaceae bacterium]|nr:GNAT family N-acetyltransferase [Sporichthyaceae bacterium]